MNIRMCVMVVALGMGLGLPTSAHADWFVVPFAGINFGGRTSDPPRLDFGVVFGWPSEGPLKLEIDLSRSPDFFRVDEVPDVIFSESSVTSLMFNANVSLPGGSTRFRPYASAGAGLIRSRIGADDDFIRGTSNNFGVDAGAGATWMFGARLGARGDIRYFRDLQDVTGDSEFFSFGATHVDYWRATAGIALTF